MGFKSYGLIIAASALVVGACGPVAPSVSKLSSAAGQKTSPTDGGSPAATLNTPDGGGASSATNATFDGNPQDTEIEPHAAYKSILGVVKASNHAFIEIDGSDQVRDLAKDGKIRFKSPNDRVRGREGGLLLTKTKIHVAINADAPTIASVNDARFILRWAPPSLTNPGEGSWDLSLASPSTGDAVKDQGDLKDIKDILAKYLVEVTVEFQSD